MKQQLLAGIVGLALITAACGDDGATSTSETTSEATSEPSTTTSSSTSPSTSPSDPTVPSTDAPEPSTTTQPPTTTPVTTAAPDETEIPQAIISLSPTATEMLYAIGAGDQVLAVEDFSNYPPEAADKMVGISGFTPNVEAIAGLGPDLIVGDGTNPDLLTQLDTLGIPHWEGYAATGFEDVYTQIEQLGALTGHEQEAADLVTRMRSDVAAVKEDLPELAEPLTYYHELDPTFYTVTSETFIGAVYAEIGLVNIADAVGDGNPYPQLNQEFIVAENPDLIFLACTLYCGVTAESVAARPGWDALDAVQQGGVIEMDDDIASRWGPRIVDYFQAVGDAVAAVAAARTTG